MASGSKGLVGAPAEEDSQVGLSMDASLPTVAAQKGGHCGTQNELIGRYDAGSGSRRGSLTSPCVTSSDERQSAQSGRSGCSWLVLISPT
jgi:hypothetical protein